MHEGIVHDSQGYRYEDFADYLIGQKEDCAFNRALEAVHRIDGEVYARAWSQAYREHARHPVGGCISTHHAASTHAFVTASKALHLRQQCHDSCTS